MRLDCLGLCSTEDNKSSQNKLKIVDSFADNMFWQVICQEIIFLALEDLLVRNTMCEVFLTSCNVLIKAEVRYLGLVAPCRLHCVEKKGYMYRSKNNGTTSCICKG